MPTESRSYSVNGSTVTRTSGRNVAPTVSTVTQLFASGIKDRSSTVTPGFTRAKATGKLPENRFGFSETNKTVMIGATSLRTTSTFGHWAVTETSGRIGSLWSLAEPWLPGFLPALQFNLTNEVKAKLARKILDSDIDLAVLAGEFRETVGMFGDIAERLYQARRSAGRGDLRGVAKALSMRNSKDWANAWLMANYGIRPFVNDLFGAVKALEKGLQKERYHVESATSKWQDNKTSVTGAVNSAGGLLTTTWNVKMDVTARAKYSVVDGRFATLASLGLVNPYSLGWELTKLSFVVDWAIGVGAWLTQLSVFAGRTFSGSSVTVFFRCKGTVALDQNYVRTDSTQVSSGQRAYERVTCNRSVSDGFVPGLLPALKDPVSLFTVATGSALLRQSK